MYIKQIHGFTLIELMITIAIVALLAAISVPSYKHYIQSSRRSEAETSLLHAANALERYFTEQHQYLDADLNELGIDTLASNGYYTLSLASVTVDSYVLAAVPRLAQSDDRCGTLTLNQLGQKTPGADCWS